MKERLPSVEFSEQEQLLINKLRESGPADPETRELLLQWTEEGEKEASANPSKRGHIEFNLRRAKLYMAASFKDEAWENLEAVRYEAFESDEEDLQAVAEALMDEIDAQK
jgi:hypothetical protein